MIFVVGQLGNGGLEKQLFHLLQQIKRQEGEVVCLVWNYREDDHYAPKYKDLLGESLIGLNSNDSSWRKVTRLRAVIKRQRFDYCISFAAFVNVPVYVASWGLPITAVGSLRTSARYYLKRGGFKAYMNLLLPPKILINSHQAMHELKESRLHRKVVRMAYLPNVLDLSEFDLKGKSQKTYQSISVGNVWPAKRLDRMLEIFKRLKDQGEHINHIHVGGGSDLEKIKTQARGLGLDQEIKFLGPRNDVIDLLTQSAIFLHFSDYEGSPNVIMEAMAAGLPVITTNCGDAAQYVTHGENGYMIDSFKVGPFVEYFIQLKSNEKLRANMSTKGREIIRASDISNLPAIFQRSLEALDLAVDYLK